MIEVGFRGSSGSWIVGLAVIVVVRSGLVMRIGRSDRLFGTIVMVGW